MRDIGDRTKAPRRAGIAAGIGALAAFAILAGSVAYAAPGGCCGTGDGKADATGQAAKKAPVKSGLLVDLGNTVCPIMGGRPDGKTFSEWKGLRVGHCCPGCTKRFMESPESVLDHAEIEWRPAAAAVTSVLRAKGTARDEALTSLRKKWRVVREPARPAPKTLLIDLGNKTCPIMGGDVNGKTYSEWNGLRIGHCCPGCSKRFLAAPEKTLDKAGIEWRPAAAAVAKVMKAEGTARDAALIALRKDWKILREPAAPKPPEVAK